jgi:hypothetical protein
MRMIMAGLLAMGLCACSDRSPSPVGLLSQPTVDASAVGGTRTGFAFNGMASGFPTGTVALTGGGSFDATTASNVVPEGTDASAGGGFRCRNAVAQGPLSGCERGEGVRWDTAQLLASATFKCTLADTPRSAVTGPGRVVLLADFYRAGDGNDESFRAQMIVSATDLAPEIPGDQTIWVQGVGCGDAIANFSR